MTDELQLIRQRVTVSAVGRDVVLAYTDEDATDEQVQAAISASPFRMSGEAAVEVAESLRRAAAYVATLPDGWQA